MPGIKPIRLRRSADVFFHFGQCVYRKIQQLGLSEPYLAEDNFRVEAKLLPALAFLPPDDVLMAMNS
jgi:hypothetical protein